MKANSWNRCLIPGGELRLRLLGIMQVENMLVFRRLPLRDFCQKFAKNGVMHIKDMVVMVKINGTQDDDNL